MSVELAFDPSQPRDLHGRWAHTPSYHADKVWAAGAGQRQRASGLFGNRTYAQHEAEVAKLSQHQRAIYDRLQISGMSLPAALTYAKRGRMPGSPRPPAAMNTPNMRLAMGAGMLAANNDLGAVSRARSATIQAANEPGGIELGWGSAWRTERRGKGGMWQGMVGSVARDMLAGAAQNPDNAATMRDIASTLSGTADAQLGQQLGMKVPKGAADVISKVRPENAVAAVQKLTRMGMKQSDAAKAVALAINQTPGAVGRTQAIIAGSRTVQTANVARLFLDLASPTSTAGRKAAFKAGNALPPAGPGAAPGFPVTSGSQWEKARQAVGRVKDPARRASLAKLLRKTAPKFGKTGALGKSWAAPGGAKKMTADPGGILDMAIKQPVRTPFDVVVARGDNGQAIIRHRQGGALIGRMYRNDAGQWVGVKDGGKETEGRNHQRTTLLDLISAYNGAATAPLARPQTPPLPAALPASQTPLMEQFGIPAIKLATPSTSSSDGPRTVTSGASDSSSDSGPAGLSPKGVAIYKKLMAKGFPAARALAFARRAQSFGGSSS